MGTQTVAAAGTMVVARFLDGRVLRGTTQDFSPAKSWFHLQPSEKSKGTAVKVEASELKAIFFVKTYQGNPRHNMDNTFQDGVTQGRKMRVTFQDGEVIAGYTVGYGPDKVGFFLIPADENDNNRRIYVVNAAVEKAEWV